MRRWGLAIVAILAVACGEGSPAVDQSASPTPATETAGESAQAQDAVRLRLAVEPGETFTAVMTMDMDTSFSVDGETAPKVAFPRIAFTMALTIGEVTDDAIDVTFSYEEVVATGGDEDVREHMESALAAMQGVTGEMSMTSRGELLDASIDTPTGLDPTIASFIDQMEQQLGQLAVPFPEEPVGVGESWTHTTDLEIDGVRSTTDATYTLTELEGDQYVIQVDMTATTHAGPVEGPNGEVVGEIVGGEMAGSGTIAGTLGLPIPRRGDTSASGSTRMIVQGQGGQQEVITEIDMVVRLEPAE